MAAVVRSTVWLMSLLSGRLRDDRSVAHRPEAASRDVQRAQGSTVLRQFRDGGNGRHHFWEVSLVRKTFTLAAAVVLLVLPTGTAAADAETPSKATVTIDAQHAGLLNRPPIIVTDDRHAVLVIRAGYRVRVAQPSITRQPSVATPSSNFVGLDRLMSI